MNKKKLLNYTNYYLINRKKYHKMEGRGNNTYSIEQSVFKFYLIYCLKQHQFYTYNKNNSTLIVIGSISSLTISGSNNKIIFQREILNLIINGSYNKINASHRNCILSNVVFNGSNNNIEVGQNSQNVCNIQNGRNNKIYMNSNNRNIRINNNPGNNNNMFNFGGSNISINFNGGNPNGQISKYILYNSNFILIQILNK